MDPVLFAREMRKRGWRYRRRQRGEALFGIRFGRGPGVTQAISLAELVHLKIGERQLAEHLTDDAALTAGYDRRARAI